MADKADADRKGKQFGRYLILEQLATGGMAQIFKAKTAQSRIFTLKKILPDYSSNADFIKMFLEEAKISLSLKHPNIVRVLDFGQLEGTYYLAMEFVFGRDLGNLLRSCAEKRTFIPMDVACLIIMQCARGLEYAHSMTDSFGKSLGIVHRDISPPNILVSYNGEAKILDFGIAKAVRSTSRASTRSGVLKGKFSYMSPEQAFGEPLDHQSDIFSLGIVFHELLTSKSLFYTEDEISTLEKVRKGNVPPPSKVRSDIPAELDRIVLKTLTAKRKGRYQSGSELSEAIRGFLKSYYPRSDARTVSKFLRTSFQQDFSKRQKQEQLDGWKDTLSLGGADDEILLDRSFSESDALSTKSYTGSQEISWYQRMLYDPKIADLWKKRASMAALLIALGASLFIFFRTETISRLTEAFKTSPTKVIEETSAPTEAQAPPAGSFLDWLNRAKEAEKNGDVDSALEFYNRALQINGFEQSALVRKNFMLLAKGDFQNACRWFQDQRDLAQADSLLARAACYEIQSDATKASQSYAEFLRSFPEDERFSQVQMVLNSLKKKFK
ncbi:MAG: protein kinase [Deltaproteobacteria bacterium]|nr:protein kinase [Deltaproteobacteria bacterium]